MTPKSRKQASKKSAPDSKSRTASSKRAISIKSVRDTAMLEREVLAPNTSAFKRLAMERTLRSVKPTARSLRFIGDPRNDENLIVSQFHHAMLKCHIQVVDLLVTAAFVGDIFAEAKKIVRQHSVVRGARFSPAGVWCGVRERCDLFGPCTRREQLQHASGICHGGVSLRPQHDPQRLHFELVVARAFSRPRSSTRPSP